MKTRLVFNKLIPFNGFLAMTLWPFIFVREELAKMYSTVVNNHEHIHAEQQKEMLIVGFALALIGFVFGLGWWALLFVPIFLWWYLEYLSRVAAARHTVIYPLSARRTPTKRIWPT